MRRQSWRGSSRSTPTHAGKFRFRLKAGNGEIVATGDAYESKAGVLNGVEAVKRAAASATVDDKTNA